MSGWITVAWAGVAAAAPVKGDVSQMLDITLPRSVAPGANRDRAGDAHLHHGVNGRQASALPDGGAAVVPTTLLKKGQRRDQLTIRPNFRDTEVTKSVAVSTHMTH